MKDGIRATGSLEMIFTDETTGKKRVERHDNLIMILGKNWIASRMEGINDSVMTQMEVGTDNSSADDAVKQELVAPLPDGQVVIDNVTVIENRITYSASYPAGIANGDWQEAGIFNRPAELRMLCRTTFSTKPKSPTDSVIINWTITIN